jgi:hypothetical protein
MCKRVENICEGRKEESERRKYSMWIRGGKGRFLYRINYMCEWRKDVF